MFLVHAKAAFCLNVQREAPVCAQGGKPGEARPEKDSGTFWWFGHRSQSCFSAENVTRLYKVDVHFSLLLDSRQTPMNLAD